MSLWRLTWRLTATDVLEGLTTIHEGTAELGGHFPPRVVMLHAVDVALAQAQVTPGDVRALSVTIEQTGDG